MKKEFLVLSMMMLIVLTSCSGVVDKKKEMDRFRSVINKNMKESKEKQDTEFEEFGNRVKESQDSFARAAQKSMEEFRLNSQRKMDSVRLLNN